MQKFENRKILESVFDNQTLEDLFRELPAELGGVVEFEFWELLDIDQKIDVLRSAGLWEKYQRKITKLLQKQQSEKLVHPEETPTSPDIEPESKLAKSSDGIHGSSSETISTVVSQNETLENIKQKALEINKIEAQHKENINKIASEEDSSISTASSDTGVTPIVNKSINADVVQQSPSFFGYSAPAKYVKNKQLAIEKSEKGPVEDASTWIATLLRKWFEFFMTRSTSL